MKKNIIKSLDKVIVFLLFIMGVFSSCDKDIPMYGCEPKYGMPMGKFEKSITLNEETLKTEQDLPVISENNPQDENVL